MYNPSTGKIILHSDVHHASIDPNTIYIDIPFDEKRFNKSKAAESNRIREKDMKKGVWRGNY